MTESKYQKKLIDQYEKKGYYVIKLMMTNKTGIPDLICLKPHHNPIFIEVKGVKTPVSPLQEFRIKELNTFGFEAFIKRVKK